MMLFCFKLFFVGGNLLLIFILHSDASTISRLSASGSLKCGTIDLQVCDNDITQVASKPCNSSQQSLLASQEDVNGTDFRFENVTQVSAVATSNLCHITLCDDEDLMGYCIQFPPGSSANTSQFQDVLQSDLLIGRCTCKEGSRQIDEHEQRDKHFDKNFVGVVYSPYDKYWENGTDGRKTRIPWSDYSKEEIRTGLEKISTKFSYISTYGMGTVSNTSEWYEGDKIAFVPQLAAEINAKHGYPALRVSVGIFRKDDVNLEWKSKELLNAIDASKVANEIFNGTVWGLTVTSQYVNDALKARDAIEMINQVKELNERNGLRLKVGIRLDKCSEFIAAKRPEDDSITHAYKNDGNNSVYTPLTTFQASLQNIAKITDYVLCITFPSPNYALLPTLAIIDIMQKDFLKLREALKRINPKLKLIVETGIPSHGIGNGLKNTLRALQEYWYSMADFAKREHIMFHLFEATDQPWKNIQGDEGTSKRFDINGPNGTDAHHGWWKRVNNSQPPVYIEKILEINSTTDGDNNVEISAVLKTPTTGVNIDGAEFPLLVGFFGFVLLTSGSIGYLWWKLRKAKREVISQAYVNQFHRGGDDCHSAGDDNYAVALRIPYDKKYELAKQSFKIDKSAVMGSGQSGVVVSGTIVGLVNPVAFKCTTASSTVTDIKNLMSEIKILSYIGEHENIVCMLGAYTKKIQRGIVYVALEYCSLGSLEDFLRQINPVDVKGCLAKDMEIYSNYSNYTDYSSSCFLNPGYVTTSPDVLNGYVCADQVLSSEDDIPNHIPNYEIEAITFLKWSYQIASAMEYVSAKNVIHADLAARNILLASIDHVKISDFGLSKKIYQEMGVMHDKDTPLPWRWMSPESLRNLVFSVETDVWSYAVTIWEIFSLAEVPYHGVSYDMEFVQQLEKGMRLPQAKHATRQIHEELHKCWDMRPSSRPTFTQLKTFFQSLIAQEKEIAQNSSLDFTSLFPSDTQLS